MNAVTKSGTNEIRGTVRGEMSPASFAASNNQGVVTQDIDRYNASAGVGFPIMKDTLFGYASGRYSKTTTSGLSATLNGVTSTQPDGTATAWDYFGKLTALLGQSLQLNARVPGVAEQSENQFDSESTTSHPPRTGTTSRTTSWNVSADWFASKDTILEAKYVHMTENDAYGAQTILNDRPLTIDPNNLGKYGAFFDQTRNGGNVGVYPYQASGETYKRDEVKLTASHFLDIGGTQNQIKIGGGAEFIDFTFVRPSNGWGTMTYSSTTEVRARYYVGTSQAGRRGADLFPVFPGQPDRGPAFHHRRRPPQQGGLLPDLPRGHRLRPDHRGQHRGHSDTTSSPSAGPTRCSRASASPITRTS